MSDVRNIEDLWETAETEPLVIAEVGQAHDGSLGMAHAYVDAAAEAGAGAVKFQMHIAGEESSQLEPWRVKFSRQDDTRFDYWKRMEFPKEAWVDLKAHAEDKGLVFLCSPFSLAAIRHLEEMGVAMWKVASGEVTNRLFLDAMVGTGRPILLSSGMSTLAELSEACKTVTDGGNRLGVFQCTTSYPCPPEKVGLNVMELFQSMFGCPVGLSDHSGTIYPSLAAVSLGAKLIEVHIAFSREMFGPDTKSSLTLGQLSELAEGVGSIHRMRTHPVDKDSMAKGLGELRAMFGQSLVTTSDLAEGTVLEATHLSCRKPMEGIPAGDYKSVLGRRLRRNLVEGSFLKKDDID